MMRSSTAATIAQTLISLSESAARLGVCERSVARMVARGDLRVVRCGRRVLVPVAELDRLLGNATSAR